MPHVEHAGRLRTTHGTSGPPEASAVADADALLLHAPRTDGAAAPVVAGGAAEASRAAALAADADAEVARSMLSMDAVAPRAAAGAL